MDEATIEKVIEAAAQVIDRTRHETENFSKQPRFEGEEGNRDLFVQIYGWGEEAAHTEVPYSNQSRKRDAWLREFVRLEPHLMGVVNGVVAIDKNRGWTLTGGRNQVIRFTDVLHNWEAAPGAIGWRAGMSSAALSFYTSDLGAIVELGRDGKGGPLRALYHTDPARCQLTGEPDTPLKYYPARGKAQEWDMNAFIRMVSMPSTDEAMKGLGYCAASRVLELAKIMIAVYRHDLEQLETRAPRGLMLLQGVNEHQWRQALEVRRAEMDSAGLEYYGPVAVLASGAAPVDAKIVALSQLPQNFNERDFTELMMYGYALCFGYDPSEFWPVQFGSLGRGKEAELQAEKATGKGGLDFMRTFQEQLQEVLPDTLQFEFDQRSTTADLEKAAVIKAYADAVKVMRETAMTLGQPLLSHVEARSLLAEYDIIPRHWTQIVEGAESSDVEDVEDELALHPEQIAPPEDLATQGTPAPSPSAAEQARQRLLELPHIWRVAEIFPYEPIVRYSWKPNAVKVETLWARADDIFHPRLWSLKARNRRQALARQDGSNVLFQDGEVTITEDDVNKAIQEAGRRVGPEFEEALSNVPLQE